MRNNFSAPNNVERQLEIARRALAMIHETEVGGELIDPPIAWPEPVEYFTGEGKAKRAAQQAAQDTPQAPSEESAAAD